jgi:putative alpha-1,2-mannosidase
VRFNGKPQSQVWFRHADVVQGLTVDLDMSNTPNTSLGADEAELPQSSVTFDPRTLTR